MELPMTSDSPTEAKRLRWPRFKLSTILVLVAILAWAMSIRPRWIDGMESWRQITHAEYMQRLEVSLNARRLPEWQRPPRPIMAMTGPPSFYIEEPGPNPKLKWPLLALAAFLTWKWAWAIVARRKRRRELVQEDCILGFCEPRGR